MIFTLAIIIIIILIWNHFPCANINIKQAGMLFGVAVLKDIMCIY